MNGDWHRVSLPKMSPRTTSGDHVITERGDPRSSGNGRAASFRNGEPVGLRDSPNRIEKRHDQKTDSLLKVGCPYAGNLDRDEVPVRPLVGNGMAVHEWDRDAGLRQLFEREPLRLEDGTG